MSPPFKFKTLKKEFYFISIVFYQTEEEYIDKQAREIDFGTQIEFENYIVDMWGRKFFNSIK